MSEPEFSVLRQRAQAMLQGSAGAAELQLQNYSRARADLRDALTSDPNALQNIYAPALADLEGKNKNSQEGYWYLARAVNLSQGTPQGSQIAAYARVRYVRDSGSSSAWN